MNFIGIDPGRYGGIAIVSSENLYVPAKILKMEHATDHDTRVWLYNNVPIEESFAVLEDPTGSVMAQRGRNIGVSSVVKLGERFGFVRGLLVGLRIPFDVVRPQKWQKAMGVLRTDKNEGDTAKKNRHKSRAQELFPSLTVTHAVADALLIAEFARRMVPQAKETGDA